MGTVQLPEAFDFLFDETPGIRHRWSCGGRGSAKSHAFATALVLKAAMAPKRILCAREIQASIKASVKALIEDKIKEAGLERFFESTLTEIRGANGSQFMFVGLWSRPDSLKSMEAIDIAWVEEAATVSQRSIDLLIPTVRKVGSELWWSWNPRFETDPVDVMFRGPNGPPPGSVGRMVSYAENPWFPEVLRRDLEWDRDRDPDKYAHIWLGEYQKNSESRVFKNWRVEEFETPGDAVFDFGADWGFATDPNVLVRTFTKQRPDGRLTMFVDHEVWAVGCAVDLTPALFAGSDTKAPPRWPNPNGFPGIPGAHKWVIRADSSRPELIAYLKERDFRIEAAKKGAGSVEDGVAFLQSMDIVVHPRCKRTIDELTLYSYVVDKHTGVVTPVLEDKNNHAIDALRYAQEARRLHAKTPSLAFFAHGERAAQYNPGH
ncbi:MAG: PBSX family phage terminase large subunit [Alphaproteobacteria bacterium]|nr:PBSX family phage terminase large subunit [Alphaproteobacteria bacterium]